MSSIVWKAPLILVSIGVTATASATVIYGGGGSYTLQAPLNDNVQVIEDAQLVVGSGGRITGVESSEPPLFQGAVRVNGGALDAVGNARINAGGSAWAINATGGPSNIRLNDQARVTGNIVNYYPAGHCCDESGGSRLYVSDRAVVDGSIGYAGYIRVADQATVLGSVRSEGSYNLDMRGGTVAGTAHMHGINGYWLNMEGGAILGGVDAYNSWDVQLAMSGGYIGNGFRVAGLGSVDGEIRGGQIDGGLVLDSALWTPSSDLTLSGGQFNADASDWLLHFSDNNTVSGTRFSQLSIWGGQFGYQESGLGFLIDNHVNFDIHGRDLLFTDGWLSGYLLDGSWLNTALTFGSGWDGTFTIHNVPEPGSLALLLPALFGVFAFRRAKV